MKERWFILIRFRMRILFLSVIVGVCALSSPNVSAQLVGHERWSGKDYFVVELVHGRNIEAGSVLKLADYESGEIFDADVLAVSNIGIDLELELYRVDHNLHFYLEVPIDGIDLIQR